MLSPKWSSEDYNVDDIDPGKDIFALLFLSFFLINAVILICITKPGPETVNVNTSANGGKKVIDAGILASIKLDGKKLCITQSNKAYRLPEDIDLLVKQGKFEISQDKNGNKTSSLIIKNPGKSITAGEMLSIVNILNNAEITVDFRAASEK